MVTKLPTKSAMPPKCEEGSHANTRWNEVALHYSLRGWAGETSRTVWRSARGRSHILDDLIGVGTVGYGGDSYVLVDRPCLSNSSCACLGTAGGGAGGVGRR